MAIIYLFNAFKNVAVSTADDFSNLAHLSTSTKQKAAIHSPTLLKKIINFTHINAVL